MPRPYGTPNFLWCRASSSDTRPVAVRRGRLTAHLKVDVGGLVGGAEAGADEVSDVVTMRAAFFPVILIAGFATVAAAFEGDLLWTSLYGGSETEDVKELVQTADSSWIILGETNSVGAGSSDVWLICLDSNGDSLWSHTYGDALPQVAWALVPAADNGWLLVGDQYVFGVTWWNAWLERLDAVGNVLWSWLYASPLNDEVIAGLPAEDGFLVAGHSESIGAGGGDQWLIHMNSAGDTLWTRSCGGSGVDHATFLLPATNSGSLLVGYSTSFTQAGQDVTLWRSDSQGDSLWFLTYGEEGPQAAQDVLPLAEGGWLLSISTQNHFGNSGDDVWLLRIDADGQEVWSQFYSGTLNDEIHTLLPTAQGGWIMAGSRVLNQVNNYDFWLMGVDVGGDTLWSRTYGLPDREERLQAAIATSDGGCLLGGYVVVPQTNCCDWWILKVNAQGDSLWSTTFGNEAYDDFLEVLVQTPEGNYWALGTTQSFGTGSNDIALLCLAGPDTSAIIAPAQSPPPTWHFAPHPNPFNPTTTLTFTLPAPARVRLEVFDINGRAVGAQHAAPLPTATWYPAGTHRITFDGSDLPSGVYLYRITAGQEAASGKMMLLK